MDFECMQMSKYPRMSRGQGEPGQVIPSRPQNAATTCACRVYLLMYATVDPFVYPFIHVSIHASISFFLCTVVKLFLCIDVMM